MGSLGVSVVRLSVTSDGLGESTVDTTVLMSTKYPAQQTSGTTMQSTAIFLPPLLLMFWTLTVLLVVPFRRVKAVMQKRVTPQDFSHGESGRVPPDVALPNRIFMNLLEVPVLFYVVAFMAYLTNQVNGLTVGLAWAYVALRFLHTGIYFTYNHVGHRALVFGTSNVLVSVLICYVAYHLM